MAFVEIRTQDNFKKLVGELDPDRLLLRTKVGKDFFLIDLLDYIANPEKYQGSVPAVKTTIQTMAKNGRRT